MARRVKHAKIIAKQANQRSAEEADRKRQQLDVRQSLTEIRRNVLLRMPRSKHMGRGQSEISRILYAAGRIQNWWRSLTITHSLRKIKEVDGLSVERLREMSFEVMANHVQQIKNMSLISKIIPNATEADTKVFLSAFLVVHHPSEIFSEIKDEEKVNDTSFNL
jgi:hypothetical protein